MKTIYMEPTLIHLVELGFEDLVNDIVSKGKIKNSEKVKYVVIDAV